MRSGMSHESQCPPVLVLVQCFGVNILIGLRSSATFETPRLPQQAPGYPGTLGRNTPQCIKHPADSRGRSPGAALRFLCRAVPSRVGPGRAELSRWPGIGSSGHLTHWRHQDGGEEQCASPRYGTPPVKEGKGSMRLTIFTSSWHPDRLASARPDAPLLSWLEARVTRSTLDTRNSSNVTVLVFFYSRISCHTLHRLSKM